MSPKRARLGGLGRSRLRLILGLFFLALALPTAVLVWQAYRQLKWESFHQHRNLAEELSARVDARLARLIEAEEARSFSDYAFLTVAGDPKANFLQRSPLSEFPPKSPLPGLLGWFQVDAQGEFSTPWLPPRPGEASYGVPPAELTQRRVAESRLWEILARNRLIQRKEELALAAPRGREDSASSTGSGAKARAPAEAVVEKDFADSPARAPRPAAPAPAQAAFDALGKAASLEQRKQKQEAAGSLGNVEELKLGSRYQPEAEDKKESSRLGEAVARLKRAGRKEQGALPEPEAPAAPAGKADAGPKLRVATFESEIDPFEFARLDSGHFVLFRKVWRDGRRTIQGLLIDAGPFLAGTVEAEFRRTALSRMSKLAVAHQGEVLAAYSGAPEREYLQSAREMRGELLYRVRLSAPLGDLELIYTLDRLPAGPGGRVVGWLAGILALVLCGGFYLMYRLGLGQIELARRQQDFISAVSHELKTPLTSIRMYGEMLRAGWVPEEKKPAYYDFIHAESERLSRLIANVLQLARLSRNGLALELKPVTGAELMDGVRSKVGTQVERAGFALNLAVEPGAAEAVAKVDADAFAQIAINLVDNALKFSAKSSRRAVDLGLRLERDRRLVFSVRDYGPGVPRDQMKKIFRLFYRLENELTRETVGTGIGLALVHQLALAMDARVEVVNREPGVEFRVVLRADVGVGAVPSRE